MEKFDKELLREWDEKLEAEGMPKDLKDGGEGYKVISMGIVAVAGGKHFVRNPESAKEIKEQATNTEITRMAVGGSENNESDFEL